MSESRLKLPKLDCSRLHPPQCITVGFISLKNVYIIHKKTSIRYSDSKLQGLGVSLAIAASSCIAGVGGI